MPSSNPTTLQRDWSLGMRRNRSRDAIGSNALWSSYDWIINRQGSPLSQRGPWIYTGVAFSGSPGRVRSMVDAPFNAGHDILAVDSTGQVYRTSGNPPFVWSVDGTTQNVGTLLQNPLFFLDSVVIPAKDTSSSLYLASHTTVVPYTDCAITHKPTRLTKWKSRLVGASGEFVVFGPPIGDTGTLVGNAWDEDSLYGVSRPIVALHEMRGAILIFYEDFIERIRGTTPAGYGVTEDDILREDLFAGIGCCDAYSITEWNDFVVWAGRQGIYYTDGSGIVDLTDQAGMKDYYTEIMQVWQPSTMRMSSGILDDLLFMTLYDFDADEEITTFVVDLPRRIMYHFSNFPFSTFIRISQGGNETWAGVASLNGRVASLRGIMFGTGSGDDNGVDILPVLESPYLRYGNGPQQLVDCFVGYELADGPGATIEFSSTVEPDPTGVYTTFGDGTESLGITDVHGAADSGYHYKRISVREEGAGIAYKLTRETPAGTARIYNVSGTLVPLPGNRSF